MKRFYFLLGCVLFISILAGACAPSATPTNTDVSDQPVADSAQVTESVDQSEPEATENADSVVTESPDEEPSTVIIGMSEAVEFLNVIYTQGGNALSAAKLAQRGLLFLDEESNWIGELAVEVPSLDNGGVSQDGKTITFHLREGMTFHDDTPVTSADVKATWEMIMNPKNAVITRFGYDKITSIDTPDDYTVVLNFDQPFMSWQTLFDAIVPKHVIEENQDNLDKSEAMRVPVGFGPYKLVEWVTGDYIKYEAFDNYWNGRPKIDYLIIKTYPSVDAQMQAIEAKEIDIAWSIPVTYIPQVQAMEDKGVVLVSSITSGSDRYIMNPSEPLFQDVNVRRAIHHAIDRQALIDEQLYGYGSVTNSEWGGTAWENTNIEPYEYDVAKCNELMESAGWVMGEDGIRVKDGVRFSFTHLTWSGNLQRENTQLIVQQMLKECGIEMVPAQKPSSELFGGWTQNGVWSHGDYQMGGWSHSLRKPDPEISNRFLCSEIASEENPAGSQWMRYCNPEVDALLNAQASELDTEKRKEILFEIQEILHEDAYHIYLFLGNSNYAVNADLKNFVLHPYANFYFNPEEWEW